LADDCHLGFKCAFQAKKIQGERSILLVLQFLNHYAKSLESQHKMADHDHFDVLWRAKVSNRSLLFSNVCLQYRWNNLTLPITVDHRYQHKILRNKNTKFKIKITRYFCSTLFQPSLSKRRKMCWYNTAVLWREAKTSPFKP